MRARFCVLGGVALAIAPLACAPTPAAPAPAPAATAAEPEPAPAPAPAQPAASEPPAPEAPVPARSGEPAPQVSAVARHVPDLAESLDGSPFSNAAGLVKKGDWPGAKKALKKALAEHPTETRERAMAGHALLGRACEKLGDAKCADAEHAKVLELWKDPKAAAAELEALGGSDVEKAIRTRTALMAVGEATFHAAEQTRALAQKIKAPVYSGPADTQSVVKHITTKMKGYIDKKRAAIETASSAYQKILEIQPVPPPPWVVAAAERVGTLWSGFVDDILAAPIPKNVAQNPELRAAYQGALDDAVHPLRGHALGAFKTCADYAKRYEQSDAYTKHCDDWLAAHPAP